MYSPVHTTTPRTMGGLLNHAWPIKIAYLDSALPFLGTNTVFKSLLFRLSTRKRSVFRSLRFEKSTLPKVFSKVFVFNENDFTHGSFTCGRKAKTDKKNKLRFTTKTHTDGRAISNTLFSDDDNDRMFT